MDQESVGVRAFEFDGNWREYAPIAFTNLLLSIVTLGVYSFWARARERRYLWHRTRFIDDRLEWTGTGLELFLGYVIVFVAILLPLGALQFVVQALAIRGHDGAAALMMLGFYLFALYLVGIAVFRGLRYRLSRTHWHGIRGGSDDQGLRYGFSHLWKTMAGGLVLGLLVPWALVTLWNERWNAMSFGPHRFQSGARVTSALIGRYLLYYLMPIVMFVGAAVLMIAFGASLGSSPAEVQTTLLVTLVLGYLGFFVVLGLIAVVFYAAYFREVVSNLSLSDLDFQFNARSTDWLKLFATNALLVVCTLGIGMIFVRYRNWAFFVGHMQAFGTLNLDDFTQSTTRTPNQGEGLLDAFDVGAF